MSYHRTDAAFLAAMEPAVLATGGAKSLKKLPLSKETLERFCT